MVELAGALIDSTCIIFMSCFLLKVKQNICAYCYRREIRLLRNLITCIFKSNFVELLKFSEHLMKWKHHSDRNICLESFLSNLNISCKTKKLYSYKSFSNNWFLGPIFLNPQQMFHSFFNILLHFKVKAQISFLNVRECHVISY